MGRCTIVAIAVLLPALAQADVQTEADRLFDEGRVFREKNKLAEACDRFERAYALDQSAGIAGNLAWCLHQRGELRRAWRLYLTVAKEWDREDTSKGDKARSEAAAVASAATTVVLRVANPDLDDLKISINDEDFTPAATIRELVEPGALRITASAPGYRAFERRKKGARGETVEIEIRLSADGEPLPPPPPPSTDDRRASRMRWATGLLIGAGVAGVAALGLSIYGYTEYNSIPAMSDDELKRRGILYFNVGSGFGIASGALALTSAILYFTAPRARVIPVAAASQHASLVGLAFRF